MCWLGVHCPLTHLVIPGPLPATAQSCHLHPSKVLRRRLRSCSPTLQSCKYLSRIISKVLSELDFLCSFFVSYVSWHPYFTPHPRAWSGPRPVDVLLIRTGTGGVFWALPRQVLALVPNYPNSHHFFFITIIEGCLLQIMTPSSG